MNLKTRIMNAISQTGLLALFLVAGLDAGVAYAQDAPSKIGVIDVRRLVSDSDSGKQALGELEALRDTKSAELQTLSQELEGLQTQITEGRLSLSQERLSELNRELEDKGTAYRRRVQDAEQEMQDAQIRKLGAIEQEVLPLIQQIGEEQAFAAILSITDGGVVYAHDQVDITDAVVARYNQLKAAGPTTAPAADTQTDGE